MAPMTAPTNSFCRSGLAENWANELFWACCLRGLALFQPVLDVGDDVAHTRIRVIAAEQVVDLLDDVGERHPNWP